MREIATLKFRDLESADDVVAVCRAAAGMVGLCVSLTKGSDVETFVSPDDCRKLIEALSAALDAAEKGK